MNDAEKSSRKPRRTYARTTPLDLRSFVLRDEDSPQQKFLQDVRRAFLAKDYEDPTLLEYWRTLVRDSEGRWAKYHKPHPNYFIGTKPKPVLGDSDDARLLEINLAVNQRFLNLIAQMRKKKPSDTQFFNELIAMHKIRAFLPETAGILMTGGSVVSHGSHTDIVLDDVEKMARKYADSYECKGERRVMLSGIPTDGLPLDAWIGEKNHRLVFHQYPNPSRYSEYVREINRSLSEFMEMDDKTPLRARIDKIAEFHQYGVNVRMFERTNQAFFLGMSNTLLREMGLRGIEGGILDFVGMRLQPANFKKYFFDEVQRVNTQIA